MKKILILFSMLSTILIGVACSPKVAKTTTTESTTFDISKFSEAQLAQGAQIMNTSCNKCHKLHEPQKFDVEKWNRVLKRMIPKAKLSEQDGNLVKAYIFKNAKSE